MTASFKKILVTGSSGVLGSAFRSIHQEYPQCDFVFSTSKDCNLTNFQQVFDYVDKIRPDAILHLAALSGGIGLSSEYPATILRENVLMSISILEAARKFQVRKTVMTLSYGMYPVQAPCPIKEGSIHEGPPHKSNYGYAFAKRLIEPLLRSYRAEYGLKAMGLVPNGIYGEGDNFKLESATFIAALIRRFYENRDRDSPIVVWGDGSPLRELTYSKDMARAFMWCLLEYDSEEILNVGTSEEHSIKEIAFMIAEEMGVEKSRIVFDPSKPSGVFRRSVDHSKFESLSHFQFLPLRSGLRHTIKWFEENYAASGAMRL